MNSYCRNGQTALLLAIFGTVASAADDQTKTFLDAKRIHNTIAIGTNDKKGFTYALDDSGAPRDLKDNQTFLADDSIAVTYPNFNPLRVQLTLSTSAVADSSSVIMGKLLEALIGIPPIVNPAPGGATGGAPVGLAAIPDFTSVQCTAQLRQAVTDVHELVTNLYPPPAAPAEIQRQIGAWRTRIDGLRGAAGVSAALADIATYKKAIDDAIDRATDQISKLNTKLAQLQKPATDCDSAALLIYDLVKLDNPTQRVTDLKRLSSSIDAIATALKPFEKAGKWTRGNDYVVGVVEPGNQATVKASTITLSLGASGITTATEDLSSGTFTIRRFSRFATELATGLIISNVKQPKYGTATKDGKTVVGLKDPSSVSYNAAVVVDFVCQCGFGPDIQPIIQVGALASKDNPAVLVGGGLRLFSVGGGSFALTGGTIIAWIKDLTKLSVDSPIGGTTDIDNDLKFKTPKPRAYLGLMYNFSWPTSSTK